MKTFFYALKDKNDNLRLTKEYNFLISRTGNQCIKVLNHSAAMFCKLGTFYANGIKIYIYISLLWKTGKGKIDKTRN